MVHAISSTSPNDDVSPSIALSEASVPPSTSIESILDREMAMYVIKLYFDHVSVSSHDPVSQRNCKARTGHFLHDEVHRR